MLHELSKLFESEDYGQEKHIHSIISTHMEECVNDMCPCKNYEPEYDKKFTVAASTRRLTKSYTTSVGGGTLNYAHSISELKKLPYKITYKTKLDIFK